MKRLNRMTAMVAGVLLTSTAAFAQTRGGCASVVAGSLEKNKGAFSTTFSATEIIDLDLAALFTPGVAQRFGSTHYLEVRIFSPSGNLYQSIGVPFTTDASKKGKKAPVEGYPRPMPTQVLEEVNHGGKHLAARVKLPVAGTAIVANSLYGDWSAVAYVDGETLPCAASAKFTITQ